MYLEHFGLREAPFRLTPLSDFFFTGARRGATVEALVYAVVNDEGIIKVSGEVGTGKTMVCRVLIERLPDTVDVIYLANPSLDPRELLLTLATELGLSLPGEHRGALLPAIQDVLIERHAKGRRVVLLIDEAHAMPKASLEQIRLLSNLETGRHKLLHLVLFGQPELDTLLAARDMRQLKDRITHHFRLTPLTPAEVTDYLDFRMRTAGYRGPALFSPAATRRIARISGGLTRRVNVLADKALLAAFTENLHVVNPVHVRTAAIDAEYVKRRRARPPWWLITTLFAAAAIIAWQQLRDISPAPARRDAGMAAAKDSPPAESGAPATQREHAARAAPAPSRAITPAAEVVPAEPQRQAVTPPRAPAPKSADDLSAPRPADTQAQIEPAGQATEPATPRATLTPPPEVSTSTPPPVAPPAAPAETEAPPTAPNDPRFGPAANAALAAQAHWMETAADETWFVQLHTNTGIDADGLERQIADAEAALPDAHIRLYSTTVGANTRTGVIFGEFDSEAGALAAIRALPATYRAAGAYVRQARRLR